MRTTFAKHTVIAAIASAAALTALPATAHAIATTPVPSPVPSPVPESSVQKDVTGMTSLNGKSSGALAHTVCDSIGHNATDWWANCRVLSGYARAWSYCSNGTYRYGSWVGLGYWKFGGSCAPYRLRDFGVQISD